MERTQTEFSTAPKGLEAGKTRVQRHIASGLTSSVPVPSRGIPQYTYRTIQTDPTGQHRPAEQGLKGWGIGNPYKDVKSRKHNDFFGPQTVWTAKTLKGAHRFFDELVLNTENTPRGETYEIYRIKNRDTPWSKPYRRGIDISSSRYPEMGAARDLRDVDYEAPSLHKMNIEHKKAFQEVVKHNREVVLEGPIPAEHIELIRTIHFTPEEYRRRLRQPHMLKLHQAMKGFKLGKSRMADEWRRVEQPTREARQNFMENLNTNMEAFYKKQKETFDDNEPDIEV